MALRCAQCDRIIRALSVRRLACRLSRGVTQSTLTFFGYGSSTRFDVDADFHRRKRSLESQTALRSDCFESARNASRRRDRSAWPDGFWEIQSDAYRKNSAALDGSTDRH